MNHKSDEILVKWRVANSNVQRLQNNILDLTTRLQSLDTDLQNWNGAKTLLEYLKNYKLEKRKDFILGIINSAMRDIFESDYKLDIQPRETKGKSAASTQKYDIIFYQNGIEIARNDELLTSNGGGVLSIASLFFKILIGYLYSKNKFYIFDEALSQVSPQYRKRLSKFLKVFCEKYGFTLVIVSQTEELEEHADIVYEVSAAIDEKNVPVLEIDNIIGERPTENYFYSHIKNFQSIKDQSFIFKGFTIIRGPNNSGKSASLRAIEAILFNNFKTDSYPRKNPNGKKLTTEITFGYVGESTKKEIGLRFKSGKVMFIIEGEEYFGKSLAADKLKEAVEEIGFRYIDVKKMYKNFKGTLKEQTERIAYTNQYDGLFLIGSKASDSEKIFSFLFNTENIALAIAQSKEEMQEMAKEHKDLQIALVESNEELTKAKIQVDYYLKLYYVKLIEEFKELSSQLNRFSVKSKSLEQIVEKIQIFTSLVDGISWLKETEGSINKLRNKVEYNNTQKELIERLVDNVNSITSISDFIKITESSKIYKEKTKTIIQLIPKIEGLIDFYNFLDLQTKINYLNNQLADFNKSREALDNEYSLCECQTCQGLGVIPN